METQPGSRFRDPRCRRLAFAAAVLVSCAAGGPAGAVEIVAHRGAYLLHPENTLAAFRGCAGLADRIEFDVRTSADGQLVVIHDPAVNRTTAGWGSVTNVAQLTLAQLQALDAGADPVFFQVVCP